MKSSKIGIAIVTYNAQDFISDCLDSIKNLSYKNTLVIIIDNASTDDTYMKIKKEFAFVHVIKNKKNFGYAKACNQAAQFLLKQKCEYVLLLNPDTIVLPDLVGELLTPFSNPQIGVSGAIITYTHDQEKIWFGGGFIHPVFGYTRHSYMNNKVDHIQKVPTETDFITGCCMLIKREIIDQIGLFDPNYKYYFEDVDFCWRVKESGFVRSMISKPLLSHRVSASTGDEGKNDFTEFKAYYFARNNLKFIIKHTQYFKRVLYLCGFFAITTPYYIFKMVRTKKVGSIPVYIKGITKGLNL